MSVRGKTHTLLLRALSRSERWILSATLFALTLLCWLYLVLAAEAMDASRSNGGGIAEWCGGDWSACAWLMPMGRWSVAEFALGFAMWTIMMIGMMAPSVAPMLFAYLRIAHSESSPGSSIAGVSGFLTGYLLIWGGFSLLATAAQWMLHITAALTPMMVSSSDSLNAALLIAAGVYQFTPLKHACLSKCRVPLGFLLTEWRDGTLGTLIMGFRHGMFCAGCCCVLMALLFVGGVMNLLWIAVLSMVVLVEKLLPFGLGAARLAGGVSIASGLWFLARAVA